MIYDIANCGACRTCEIACSYHHTGEFTLTYSSFRVLEREDGKGYRVSIAEEKIGDIPGCDGCEKENIPLCVDVCEEQETLKDILTRFLALRKNKGMG